MYFVYVEPKYISGINESIKKSIDIYENKKISMSDQNKPDPELSDALGKFTHILQSADIIRYSFDRKTWSVVPSNGKLQAIDVVGAIRSLASKGDGGALLYYRGVERLYSKWGIAPAIDIDAAESIVSECRKRGFAG